MTLDEYHALIDAGVLGKVEMLDGVVVFGNYELAFSPQQVRDARRIGVNLPSPVDAVLADDDLRRSMVERLG